MAKTKKGVAKDGDPMIHAGRGMLTDREAMMRDILERDVVDASFSGEPVAANEMPASVFESDRAMSERSAADADARAEELEDSGAFQVLEGNDPDTVGSDVGETAAAAPANAGEPTEGAKAGQPKKAKKSE